ncbi:enoyl-CoA hydratase-related protein [Rummeliibacillus stabekisii]|uniref:enoyl-CoA hydratase-related protein n=1 Tax=Rummeliibacillus stabekisii TaxID=241244 RepID=UPI001166BF01|nr:enoyl-CoA hydratase-related protein [Rummeliibacillus stabekisii]MBB5170172.1 2-(1,2-epoxy-1,2-dihydrophenyl)acetyl-CoA isomerase [Rummeliibacillus stabekisii]GEL04430.1 2-(1,2-epoxy-1,2-dihydrophenyl)acetyl-CoA isomerase [Rummeliibacillus stabekisii]
MFETIHYDVRDGVAWLTLNRPDKLNAFTARMNSEIKDAVKTASRDEEVRTIVITGAGRAFCSGQDLSDVDETMDHGDILRSNYGPMVKEMRRCEKPIVAAVNGVAAGAGFSLALACDFRLVSENASFINAFIHVGLIPDSGNLYFLTKLVGEAKAAELAMLGEKIPAERAVELGLANRVFSAETFTDEVHTFAARLATMPTKAMGLIKRSLKDASTLSFDEYLEREAQGQRIAGLTADHREGVDAFMQKRKPVFQGK